MAGRRSAVVDFQPFGFRGVKMGERFEQRVVPTDAAGEHLDRPVRSTESQTWPVDV